MTPEKRMKKKVQAEAEVFLFGFISEVLTSAVILACFAYCFWESQAGSKAPFSYRNVRLSVDMLSCCPKIYVLKMLKEEFKHFVEEFGGNNM